MIRRSTAVVVMVVPLCVVGGVGYWYATADQAVDDAYALMGAAEMVVGYLESHDGAWPRSWSDLRPEFEKANGRVAGWSYERFQSRVEIDFGVDADAIRRAALESPAATFDVVRPKHFGAARMGEGPNQRFAGIFASAAITGGPAPSRH